MYEQTDFSTFSVQKAQKGRYSPKQRNKGRKKQAFPKKEGTFGKGLEDRRSGPIVEGLSAGSASAVSRQCCCAHSPQR